MNLETLIDLAEKILVLRGGRTSGNWGHQGRPGKKGGSKRGAGFKAIGVRGKPTRKEVKEKAKKAKKTLEQDVKKIINKTEGADPGWFSKTHPDKFYDGLAEMRGGQGWGKSFDLSTEKITLSQAQALASHYEKEQAGKLSKTSQKNFESKKQSPKAAKVSKKTKVGDLKNATEMSSFEAAKSYESWHNNMSPDENKALVWYQGNGYKTINGHLRSGAAKGQMTDQNIANLDKAIAKTSLPKDTILYRGTAFSAYSAQLGDDPSKWVGKTFEDKGYMSTTVDFAQSFSGVKAVVRAPKGTKGGFLGNLPGGSHNNEQEILMARGTKMVITGVQYNPTGKWITGITTEVIDQP
jgi:hypothetical protein